MSEVQPAPDPTPGPSNPAGWRQRASAWWQSEWEATLVDARELGQRAQKWGQQARTWSVENRWFLLWTFLYLLFVAFCWKSSVDLFRRTLLWWPSVLVLAFLVSGTVFYIVAVLLPTWRRGKEEIIQHGVAFITLLAMIVLGVGFVLWLLVNFYWAAEEQMASADATSLSISHPLPADARTIFQLGREQLLAGTTVLFVSAAYPKVALVDATDNQLRLNVTATVPGWLPETTLAVRVEPHEWLTFPDARDREVRLSHLRLGRARPTSLAVALVNAETYSRLRHPTFITVQVRRLSEATWHKIAVPVVVEGTRGFALRRFVTSTINENSPYIFALLLIAPGLAALTQKTIDQRYAELQARRQKEYKQLVAQCQEQLRCRDFEGAKKTLTTLKGTAYQGMADDSPKIAAALVDYSGSGRAIPDAKKLEAALLLAERWPNEFVAAWLAARKKPEATDDHVTKGKKKILDWDPGRISDKTLQDEFYAEVAADHVRAAHESKSLLRITETYLSVPFQHTDARNHNEQEFLFGKNAFCGVPKLIRDLQIHDDRRSFIVFGQEGCGRTALACAFARKHKSQDNRPALSLRVPLEGQPDMHAVCAAVMETLFAALQADPSPLELLNVSQKETLADLLLVYLGYLLVLFEIEEAQKRPGLASEFPASPPDAASNSEPDPAQRRSLALQQLKRLVQARNAAPPERLATLRAERGATPDGAAYRAIAKVARTLGYRGIVFVYDAEADAAKWLRRMVLGQLDRWHARHTSFALFAPVAVYEALTKATANRSAVHWPANLEKHALVWSRKELTALARERYVRFRVESKPGTDEKEVRPEAVIRAHFKEDDSFEHLLDAGRRPTPPAWAATIDGTEANDDYSPRLFMERWQAATKGHTYLSKDIVVPAEGAAADAPEGKP